jgi:hypothetical protein
MWTEHGKSTRGTTVGRRCHEQEQQTGAAAPDARRLHCDHCFAMSISLKLPAMRSLMFLSFLFHGTLSRAYFYRSHHRAVI